mgnify:CR=1 FL=1
MDPDGGKWGCTMSSTASQKRRNKRAFTIDMIWHDMIWYDSRVTNLLVTSRVLITNPSNSCSYRFQISLMSKLEAVRHFHLLTWWSWMAHSWHNVSRLETASNASFQVNTWLSIPPTCWPIPTTSCRSFHTTQPFPLRFSPPLGINKSQNNTKSSTATPEHHTSTPVHWWNRWVRPAGEQRTLPNAKNT